MNKKIAFISELGFNGKIGRDHRHMRTEYAQFCALGADHYNVYGINNIEKTDYDHVILLISKTPKLREDLYEINLVEKARRIGKKIWWMQESTTWIYQDKPLHLQIWHYNTISDCDAILSENDTDWSYYKGHWPDKPVHTIPTLMIEDTLLGAREVEREDKTMMGGNFVSWYGGFDSYMISRLFENPIYQPSMRSIDGEDQLVNVLPHMQFVDWIYKLAEFKYAVHLMPSITAGTFVLNCAFLGVPCIGYAKSDPQRLCHPSLGIEHYDMETARKLAIRLRDDTDFYNKCSKEATDNHNKYFGEKVFLNKMEKILC